MDRRLEFRLGKRGKGKVRVLRGSVRVKRAVARCMANQPVCFNPFGWKQHWMPTTVVHHIFPMATYPDLAAYGPNMVGLCDQCHNRIEDMVRQGHVTQPMFITQLKGTILEGMVSEGG